MRSPDLVNLLGDLRRKRFRAPPVRSNPPPHMRESRIHEARRRMRDNSDYAQSGVAHPGHYPRSRSRRRFCPEEAVRCRGFAAHPAYFRSAAFARWQDRCVCGQRSRRSGEQEPAQHLERASPRRRAACLWPIAPTAPDDRPMANGSSTYPPISDTSQIWSMNPDGHPGIAPVTRLSTEADGELVSPGDKSHRRHERGLSGMQHRMPGNSMTPATRAALDAESQSKVKAWLIAAFFSATGTNGKGTGAAICFRYLWPRERWPICLPAQAFPACAKCRPSRSTEPTTTRSPRTAPVKNFTMNTDDMPRGRDE